MKTPRCNLRRFVLSDLDNMIKLESDPDIMKYTPSKVPLTKEQSKTRLENLISKEALYAPFGVWAVETLDTQDFIGWFMLLKTDLPHPEIGFMIIRKYWGMKLSTEIAQALIDYGFTTLNLPAISARTTPENDISIKVLEKLGFNFINIMKNASGEELKVFELKKS